MCLVLYNIYIKNMFNITPHKCRQSIWHNKGEVLWCFCEKKTECGNIYRQEDFIVGAFIDVILKLFVYQHYTA